VLGSIEPTAYFPIDGLDAAGLGAGRRKHRGIKGCSRGARAAALASIRATAIEENLRAQNPILASGRGAGWAIRSADAGAAAIGMSGVFDYAVRQRTFFRL